MAKAPPFEGSPKDRRQDKAGAKKMGISQKAYERTPQDARQDRAGQAAMAGPGPGGMPFGFSRGGKVGRRGKK